MERIVKGSLVEIEITVMKAGERAPQVPADTGNVDMKLRVKGLLMSDSNIGDAVEISTPTDRIIKGILIAENPPYTHDYGQPVSELNGIGKELRILLKEAEALK